MMPSFSMRRIRSQHRVAESATRRFMSILEMLGNLEHTQLSLAQKFGLMQTLCPIMSTFVDLAFGTDPVQEVLPPITSGQDWKHSILPTGKTTGTANVNGGR
jgi:hypothetical protein